MAEEVADVAGALPDELLDTGDEISEDTDDELPSRVFSLNEPAENNMSNCVMLTLKENLTAYFQKTKLVRDVPVVTCDQNLVEKVVLNYIIAKKIISSLSWQDKLICKHVCTAWHSAVKSLEKEQIEPVDFVIQVQKCGKNGIHIKQSGELYTQPLAILTFANSKGTYACHYCKFILPNACTPSCDEQHSLLDVVQHKFSLPEDCMITTKASHLSYMPLLNSPTAEHTITRKTMTTTNPFICGICLPKIPNVEFHVINIKHQNKKKYFYDVVDNLSQDNIFKGVLVYVTSRFLLNPFYSFLNHFKEKQPDIPYALGGCVIEDLMTSQRQMKFFCTLENENDDYSGDIPISLAVFTVPKSSESTNINFDMFSLVIKSSEWTKPTIQAAINEFSKRVPRFEHSVALKLSCVGRDLKHDVEQEFFRAAFPHTRILGCYGNGEIGLNHPKLPETEHSHKAKKRRNDDINSDVMYSYSTVFVYIVWGKIIAPAEVQDPVSVP